MTDIAAQSELKTNSPESLDSKVLRMLFHKVAYHHERFRHHEDFVCLLTTDAPIVVYVVNTCHKLMTVVAQTQYDS